MGNAVSANPLHVDGEGVLLAFFATSLAADEGAAAASDATPYAADASPAASDATPSAAIAISPPHKRRPSFPSLLPFSTPCPISSLYAFSFTLASGASSTVRRCTSLSSGLPFACKSIHKHLLLSPHHHHRLRSEVSIMWKLSGSHLDLRHVVTLHDVFEDSDSVHIVMDLCRGGSLFDRMRRRKTNAFPEKEAASIFRNVLEALQACHSRGIVYGNVKPGNILFEDESDESAVKLADFGHSWIRSWKKTEEEEVRSDDSSLAPGAAGTNSNMHMFMAPETVVQEEGTFYGEQVDAWSAGVLLYVMLSGGAPFSGYDDDRLKKAILSDPISFSSTGWQSVSSSGKRLVRGLLCRDPDMRTTVSQALQHPWILSPEQRTSPTSMSVRQRRA